MKTKPILFLFLILLIGSLSACSSNDNEPALPSEPVQQSFTHKFPRAAGVEWHQYLSYQKAEFTYNGAEVDAWFYQDGTCLLAISQVAYSTLPQEVSSAISSGLYASWTPDEEVEIFEPVLVPVSYVVEVSKAGMEDRELYYSATGRLDKEVVEDYDGDHLPLWMDTFIKERYPHALVIQGEKILDNRFSLYLLNGRNMATVWFAQNQAWEYSSWPVAVNDVPTVVLDVLKGEAYQNFAIRSVEYRENSSGDYYYFDLYREGSMDITVRISPQGQIILN